MITLTNRDDLPVKVYLRSPELWVRIKICDRLDFSVVRMAIDEVRNRVSNQVWQVRRRIGDRIDDPNPE